MNRYREIDVLRGIAITLMLFLHTLWCLDYLGFNIDMSAYVIQPIVPSLFLVIAGISLYLSFSKNTDYKHWMKVSVYRSIKLIILGFAITVISLFLFPNMPVISGILTCIGISLLVGIAFIRLSVNTLVISNLLLIPAGFFISHTSIGNNYLFYLIGFKTTIQSLDYFPVVPWLWCMVFGITIGKLWYTNGIRQFRIPKSLNVKQLEWLGKHSLVIYLMHQPILYCLLLSIKNML